MSGKIEISREQLERWAYDMRLVSPIGPELRAILAAPVVERQEPVAEVQHGPFDDVGQPQWVRVVTLGDFDLENFPGGTKFFTSPPAPVADDMVRLLTRARTYARGEFRDEIDACVAGKTAPVAVVLPEPADYNERHSPNSWTDYDMGWNACLGKVKELNQ